MTNVDREIAFGLENLGLEASAITRLVEESLISLGLSHLRRAPVASLSGGELQKVALAAVLAMQPDVLLLDEPTSQLDPVSAEELLSAVRRLSDDTGTTILMAEHRVDRCLHLASRVIFMEEGSVLCDADPQTYCRWALEERPGFVPPVTRLMQPRANGRVPITVKEARGLLRDLAPPRIEAHPSSPAHPGPLSSPDSTGSRLPAHRTLHSQEPTAAVVLDVRNLSVGYEPDFPLLRHVNLSIEPGEFAVLMGENGCGKSTLVRHFNGLAQPLSGQVHLNGRPVTSLSVAEAARECALLGQNPNDYFVCETVEQELDYSLDCLGLESADRSAAKAHIIENLGLEVLLPRNPRDLSGGERTRAALATVLLGDPRLIVLDEPTRGLSPDAKAGLGSLLYRFSAEGRAVIVVTHDVEFAAAFARRVILLGDGGVLADGPSATVLDGSLFFSTQVNRLFRHVRPGVIHERQLHWNPAASR